MKTKLLAFFLLLSLAGYGQSLLKGRVTDENDQPLPGVSVLIKGSTLGTVTDTDGAYSLAGVSPEAVVVFSFIGYAPQELPLQGRTTLDLKLQPDSKALDEVIVIGYGTTTAKELTGAVSVVNGESLSKLNPVRIDQALQGQAAGVQISSASGSPGGALNIRIRGISTNGDNNPLVLVDGVQYSTDGLNALNPSDIESINVLKDASAGIYGVRAANGVIIITTKGGRKNSRPTLSFDGYYGVQRTTKKLDLLNAQEFAVLKNEAYAAGGLTPPYANTNLGTGTNWQDEVFASAPIQNYNLNMTGGTEKTIYSFGGSYLDQKGIVGDDKASYRRYNARVNFTTEIAPRLTLQSIFLYTHEQRKTLPENGISAILFNTINANPISSPYNTNGTYSFLEDVAEVVNPLAQMANTFNDARVNKLVGKEELVYKISDFEFTGRAGYNYALVDDKSFSPPVYYGAGKAMNTALNANLDPRITTIATGVEIPVYNSVTERRSTYFNYNLELFGNYSKNIGEDHKIKGTLGTAIWSTTSNFLSGTGYNVPYSSIDFADISATEGANLLNNTSSGQSMERSLSFFGRAEYSFRGKYLFSALIRRDASTNFGQNNRVGYFPAASVAWVLSEEPFFQSSVLEFVKIRASYGASGNDKIGNNRYRALLGGEAVYPFNDQLVTGVALGTLGNQDLKWESNAQSNFGVDLTMLNSKLDITADYYIKKTSDLLFQPDVSGIIGAYAAGASPPFINGGDVKNSGLELLITYKDRVNDALSFNIGYNLTTIRNRVTSMVAGKEFIESGSFGVGGAATSRMQAGYPMGYFYGFKTDGVYQTAEEIASRGVTQTGAQPGDLRFVDKDGNGSVNFGDNSDKMMIGSPIPDVLMGLNLGLDFKGFDFSTTFYSSIGNDILRNYERQQPMANLLSYKLDRWTGAGSTNEHPRLTTGANNNGVVSDYFVEDGSFVRIKNIQLGYSLPSAISKRIGATRVRVYVAVNNLATFTKYKGYDPDQSNFNPLVSGVDTGFYPQAKTFMGGLNLNF